MIKEERVKLVSPLQKKLGKNLLSVILFGSHAQGKAHKYSDFDLLAVTKISPKDWREKDQLLAEICAQAEYPLDLIMLTPKELHQATLNLSPLLLSIFEHKYEIIYGNDYLKPEKDEFQHKFKLKKVSQFGWKIEPVAG